MEGTKGQSNVVDHRLARDHPKNSPKFSWVLSKAFSISSGWLVQHIGPSGISKGISLRLVTLTSNSSKESLKIDPIKPILLPEPLDPSR
jgi:hypothetical protein